MQIEIKVKIKNPAEIEEKIKELGAKFWKKTKEKDTYFHSKKGVFKVKQSSDGECLLIHDFRPKESITTALRTELPLDAVYAEKLMDIFAATVGIQLVLERERIQYIYHGMLFAIDAITHHDTFLEITSDEVLEKNTAKAKEQLLEMLQKFGFGEKDLETKAYNILYS